MKPTAAEVRAVKCPACGAAPGNPCYSLNRPSSTARSDTRRLSHRERGEAAARQLRQLRRQS